MVQPKAFLAIERTMIAAMRSQWNKRAKKFIDELHPVLAKGRFAEAHHIIGRMSLNGVVEEVRPKLEELATSAVLFGAHHVHGSVNKTSFVKHQKAIPYEAKNAITQLVHMVEADGRDYLAKRLHALVTAFSEKHTELQKHAEGLDRATIAEAVAFVSDAAGRPFKITHDRVQKANVEIDKTHDVRWMSEMNEAGTKVYIDCTLPDEIENNGKILVVAEPLVEHEVHEFRRLKLILAAFKKVEGRDPTDAERKAIYDGAHKHAGTPGEKAWIIAHGYDWDTWEAWCRGELSRLENRKIKNPPPDPDVKAFPHGHDDVETTVKDDISDAQLGDTGGLLPPEQVENLGKKRRKKGDRSLYVRRELINTDQFLKWAKEQGFTTTLPADDLHVTVCYSKTPVDWGDAGNAPSEVSAAYDPRRVTQFGGGAVVLEFTCGELVDRNTALRTIGATSDFPGFSPHVTITYDPGSVDIGNVSPYDGLLLFGPEIFDECKDGWKDDLDEVALKLDALFKAEGGLTLAEQLNAAVTDGGTVPIDLGASLTTSRLISLGFLSEALDAGVETYIVNEILDDKTCLFCEYINGKEFSVAKQHSRLMQTLGTGDPEDLKVLAPWPGSGAADMAGIYGMSLDDLQDGGLGSPPYHPNCRGMLMQVGSTEETVPLGGPVDENGQSAADLIGLLSDMGGAAEADDLSAEVDAWPEEKTTALQDMIDTMDDSDIKDAAQDAFDNEDFDGAIGIADAALEDVNPADEEPGEDWTKDKIDALGWDHMEITDPLTFKEADDAFNSEDYDKVQAIVDKWKEANDQA